MQCYNPTKDVAIKYLQLLISDIESETCFVYSIDEFLEHIDFNFYSKEIKIITHEKRESNDQS